ncbi:MAG: Calx-beta domain-containing protein, partial [Flavobacterium sp.]|nr:Calx-beta domain-containing protein [Flavobacterium sp.]
MINFTSVKNFFFVLFLIIAVQSTNAQFFTKHYVAPAPWQYFSKANEIVIATNSTSTVNIELAKSNGAIVANLTAIKGSPAVYRFTGLPSAVPVHSLNSILNAAGLIITSSGPTSVNLRNVASDNLGSDGTDANIKGNASLTSFGDAGIGVEFRVGYYRNDRVAGTDKNPEVPVYSIMAISDNTSVKLNGAVLTTLAKGQSYLFNAAIGSLVESSKPSVMNTNARLDAPGGCGDGTFDQIPPISVLGSEYFIQRGTGNNTAEQTTVVATKPNTVLTIERYSIAGVSAGTTNVTLGNAGDFYTFVNGISNTNFSVSRISATNNVAVYSGTAQACEVDISVIAPVSPCAGSNFIETQKFTAYDKSPLLYFGYVLLKDATAVVNVKVAGVETNIETLVPTRFQIGTTGWYLINFKGVQIASPDVISLSSTAKLTVSIVQQDGGFSMAGFFSNFAQQPEDPTVSYISGGGCTNNSATLTTPVGFAPYQWYLNGVLISGATSNVYTATRTGSYSVASTLSCGSLIQSKPVTVTLCTDLGITKTVDSSSPCVGSNVEFTIKVTDLGPNNATGVSVNDLLPAGYDFVSSNASIGSYNSATGIWSIGDLNNSDIVTLKVTAKVKSSGSYTNTATIVASQPDSNATNNTASAATTPISSTPPAVNAGDDKSLACGVITVKLDGNNPSSSATGKWTIVTGTGGSFVSDTNQKTDFTGTLGTTYTLRWTISNASCTSTFDDVIITFNANPNAPIANDQSICTDGTTTQTLVATATGGTITWYDAATAGNVVANPTQVGVGTKTYYAQASNGTCSSSTRTKVVLSINSAPTVTITNPVAVCSPSTVDLTSAAVTSGSTSGLTYTYWTNAAATTVYATPATAGAGTYYIKGTTAAGCFNIKPVVVTVNPTPTVTITNPTAVCSPSTVDLTSAAVTSGSTGSLTYTYWTNSTATTAYGTPTAATAGTYYIKGITAAGCFDIKPVLVTVNPTPTVTITNPAAVCSPSTVDLTSAAVTSGSTSGLIYTYWTNAAATTAYGTPTAATAGTYYIKGTTAVGCFDIKPVVVTVNPIPTVTITNPAAVCSPSTVDLTLAAVTSGSTSGLTYTYWTNAAATTAYGTPTAATAGTYYVKGTTAVGCFDIKPVVVTVNPTPTVTITNPAAVCSPSTVDLTLAAVTSGSTSGLTYTYWTNAAATTSYGTPTAATAGTYYIKGTTAVGCFDIKPVVVTVNPTPTVTITNPAAVCSPSTVDLTSAAVTSGSTASLTYTYWTNSTATTSYGTPTAATAGTYYIKGTTAAGCFDIKPVTVNVYSPTVTLTGTTSIVENSGGNVILTATLSTATISNTIVTLTYSGTATNASDYSASSTTITIPAGSTSGTVAITPLDDNINEGSENVIVDISNVTGGCASELGTQTATVTITDNDNAPVVTIADASITEGGNLSFPVTLSNPSASDITLILGFTNGTTTNGDYTTTPVTVTFLAGTTTATATVQTTADIIDENNETFTVAITSATGTVGATTDTAIGTILDDDNAPVVTIADASITEGGILSFPVTLSNPSASDITLILGFTNGTTTNGDYTTTPVTVTFLAGTTTATATVQTTADTIDENNETFTVAITSATGTVGATTDTAIGTILDDDNAPVVTIADASITEGGILSFPVTLSNPSASDITLILGFTNGTTTNGDYTTTPVTVTFLAGTTTATATVQTT